MGRFVSSAVLITCLAIGIGAPQTSLARSVQTETIPVDPDAVPDASTIPADDVPAAEAADTAPETEPADEAAEAEAAEKPQVHYNTAVLPKPVARMHAQLKEAALLGDFKRLRMILESNEMPPTLSFGETGDPIEFLKKSSGDGEGYEILAILADVLDAGFLHVDAGTSQEMYIWPYFARYPLHDLTPDQKVELFRIVTAGDFVEMKEFGAWSFYRVGIGPDGTLHYFVAGD